MDAADQKLYYKIGEACRVVDIQPYVLRYWETEFAILQPTKSRSGQRVYSERELSVIRRIKELLYDEGYTIAGAKKKLETEGLAGAPEDSEPVLAEGSEQPPVARKARRRRGADALPFPAASEPMAVTAEERLRSGLSLILAEARALLARLESAR